MNKIFFWVNGVLPNFVVVMIGILMAGVYGIMRLFAPPALSVPIVWRIVLITLMIFLLYGNWRITGSTDWTLLLSVLAASGISTL